MKIWSVALLVLGGLVDVVGGAICRSYKGLVTLSQALRGRGSTGACRNSSDKPVIR